MKYSPILFSTLMVNVLPPKGCKTQTRRIQGLELINENPDNYIYIRNDNLNPKNQWGALFQNKITNEKIWVEFHKNINTILWVRETFRIINHSGTASKYFYKADACHTDLIDKSIKWKPSIFMPKEACRIFLKLIDIRVERIQDITNEDSIAEGIVIDKTPFIEPMNAYASLWNKINGKGSWNLNPFVWVYTFERTEVDIKDFLK
jgi:hypothetical protein